MVAPYAQFVIVAKRIIVSQRTAVAMSYASVSVERNDLWLSMVPRVIGGGFG